MGLPQQADLNIPTLSEAAVKRSKWDSKTAPSESDLKNEKIKTLLKIIRDLEEWTPETGFSRTKWLKLIGKKHNKSPRQVYRIKKDYEMKGITGLRDTREDRKRKIPKDACEYAIGIVLKSEHRRFTIKEAHALYELEAKRKGWPSMSYQYLTYLCRDSLHPALLEYRNGGRLALDNVVTPILRTYANLAPLQVIVLDQHKMDIWVIDELTGQVIRPMVYVVQDLRTRMILGLSISKNSYNAYMIGSALRMCVSCFGVFGNLFTDNGKPELSQYVDGIMDFLNTFNISWKSAGDDFFSSLNSPVTENAKAKDGVEHKRQKAKVKNGKSKPVERLFGGVGNILFSVLKLPGCVKRLADDSHTQEKDHKEMEKLAKEGKLLTFSEFIPYVFQACDIYNNKPHRGVLSEWKWNPKPREASPKDCLKACWNDGWRPNKISEELTDLVFLAPGMRVVNKGMILLNKEYYTHDALVSLHGQRLSIRYDPMLADEVHCFKDKKYICTARPVERSNMLDQDLISRKNTEKKKLCKIVIDEYKRLTAVVPDFRQYSNVPAVERVAALIGSDRKRRVIENQELSRTMTQDELDAGLRRMEALNMPIPEAPKKIPERPKYFPNDSSRYFWTMETLIAGSELSQDDQEWLRQHIEKMPPPARTRHEFDLEYHSIEM